MAKGKKGKGKKEKEPEGGDTPAIGGLTISEDAPSTSQPADEEEVSGLGLGEGRKKKQKKPQQQQSEQKQLEPTPPPEADKPLGEAATAPPKPEEKVEEESEGLGLGLGLGGEKKKRQRKKKTAEATAAAKPSQAPVTEASPVVTSEPALPQGQGDPGQFAPRGAGPQPGSVPGPWQRSHGRGEERGPGGPGHAGPGQAYPGQPGPVQAYPGPTAPGQADPGQFAPREAGPQPGSVPGPWQQSRGRGEGRGRGGPGQAGSGQAYPGSAAPSQAAPGQAYQGQTGPRQAGPGGPWQAGQPPPSRTLPGQAMPPQPSPQPVPSGPQSTVSLSPRAEACRFKIPSKIIGRMVRSTPVRVITNYLPMTFKPIKVYRYDVAVKPDKPKKMMAAVFKHVQNTHFSKDFIAFDQAKNCYAFQPLKNVPRNGSRYAINVELKDQNQRTMNFEVSFKETGVVDYGKIKLHMETGGSSLNTPSEEIQCIDVILRQGALEAYVKCGRNFFKRPANPINLTGGLEMWTGLFQSAIFTSHAFINVDVAHKGFPIQQSMIAAVQNSFRLDVDRRIEDQRSREVENFLNFIKRLRVVARMVGPPNDGQTREFICNGLVDPPSKLFFTCERDNKSVKMSVADYFLKEKKYKIKYPNLNCVWVGPREKNIYYPMELLEIAYGQALNKQLNEMQLSNMVREAATPPDDRKRKIEEVARHMNYHNNAFFKKFGLEISDKFLEVDAKVLQAPTLDCGEGRPAIPRRGAWQSNKLVKPEALESWGFIAIECDARNSNYETIRDLLMNTGSMMGMTVSEPKFKYFNVRMHDLQNILYQALEQQVRFMFVIVSARGKDIYHRVKQIAERNVGILTQCIKENTAQRRMNNQTIRNILLKVNSKLMGINQVLDQRSTPACLKGGNVMIVGADVTHPSPDQTSIPSIAAVTASLDPKCFIYNIELSIQTPKKEMIVEFEDLMVDHLKIYRERNRALPRKIYVFRDGVSEGQFAAVMNSELAAVHKAYARFDRTNKPEVLFLLVQKRHHTRFFLGQRNSANVEPGTVVDTHIVHPKELDFYMVSHQAIKGTARPTRYHAVCNDGNIPDDEVEQLTFYLCHLYSRCMRSVSYPTPTYYAHLACLRARSLTYGQTFDNQQLERQPQRLRVLDKILECSRMFFV